jgi:hypothetical protein
MPPPLLSQCTNRGSGWWRGRKSPQCWGGPCAMYISRWCAKRTGECWVKERRAGVFCGTQISCFTGTKVHILVCEKDGRVLGEGEEGGGLLRYPNFLLYWYKSTKTGVRKGRASAGLRRGGRGSFAVPKFTCFTGTKVQMLTQKALLASEAFNCRERFCFPTTLLNLEVQVYAGVC